MNARIFRGLYFALYLAECFTEVKDIQEDSLKDIAEDIQEYRYSRMHECSNLYIWLNTLLCTLIR